MSTLIVSWLVMASALSASHLPQAEFGVLPGHWSRNANGFRGTFQPDSGYGRGTYAVPLDADSCFALDLNSTAMAPCSRVDPTPVTFTSDSRRFYRFRCAAGWESRDVLFLAGDVPRPLEGEALEWSPPPPETADRAAPPAAGPALHRVTMTARPALLRGSALVARATFYGRYPPAPEYDETRGDSITFGHYWLRRRSLSVEAGPTWFESRDTSEVEGGLEWAFLPADASQKSGARFVTLYRIDGGYLLLLDWTTDFEGTGVDQAVELYSWQHGRWSRRATARRTWMY